MPDEIGARQVVVLAGLVIVSLVGLSLLNLGFTHVDVCGGTLCAWSGPPVVLMGLGALLVGGVAFFLATHRQGVAEALVVEGAVFLGFGLFALAFACSGLYVCPVGGCVGIHFCDPRASLAGIAEGAAGVDMIGLGLLVSSAKTR